MIDDIKPHPPLTLVRCHECKGLIWSDRFIYVAWTECREKKKRMAVLRPPLKEWDE